MVLVTTSFNVSHPERRKDEVYVCNQTLEGYRQMREQTKRRGKHAYDALGQYMGKTTYPVFVSYPEILKQGFVKGPNGALKKDPEKAARLLPIWNRVVANVRRSENCRLGNQQVIPNFVPT